MIPLAEARATVLAGCPVPVDSVRLPLNEALGCVLANRVVSGEAVPPFANTAMDGFAVQAASVSQVPARLKVVGTLAAGVAPTVAVGPGEALRIMTGAPVPPGADAIVPVEVTRPAGAGEEVDILETARVGDHFRPAGEDITAGQEVFAAGTVLEPGHLGVLASIGVDTVDVLPRPRVGVLSTGDELVEGGAPLQPGQIRDSNRHTLLALCRQSGFDAVDLGLARDDEAVIEDAVRKGLAQCDALVTSGGVSMGDFDYVKVVLDRLSGGTMKWMQVAIKPAKPLAFGTVDGKPIFGLPGNPVSSMVSFELFARPGLRQMMGFGPVALDRTRALAVADEDLRRRPDGKITFVRVVATLGPDGRFHVRSSGGQASNLLRAMALANALAVVPDGDGIAAGGDVEVMLLGA
jgi:molybdenum cofactor synthesis domain-containing protein